MRVGVGCVFRGEELDDERIVPWSRPCLPKGMRKVDVDLLKPAVSDVFDGLFHPSRELRREGRKVALEPT